MTALLAEYFAKSLFARHTYARLGGAGRKGRASERGAVERRLVAAVKKTEGAFVSDINGITKN